VRLSRVPMQPLSVFAALFDPDRTAPTCLGFLRWFGVVPDTPTSKTSMIDLSWLNNVASTVAVYASCQHLYRLRKTRFRWMASPCRTDWLLPGYSKVFHFFFTYPHLMGLARRNGVWSSRLHSFFSTTNFITPNNADYFTT